MAQSFTLVRRSSFMCAHQCGPMPPPPPLKDWAETNIDQSTCALSPFVVAISCASYNARVACTMVSMYRPMHVRRDLSPRGTLRIGSVRGLHDSLPGDIFTCLSCGLLKTVALQLWHTSSCVTVAISALQLCCQWRNPEILETWVGGYDSVEQAT